MKKLLIGFLLVLLSLVPVPFSLASAAMTIVPALHRCAFQPAAPPPTQSALSRAR